ncbi:hypothetical protein BWZ20_06320 [Winogradskyella sp. J14-2]|uniref:glycosyltransferase family 52 n=1 Tax=Winogradskyella sp. J14-2 TaxID=1936080 RepID=UPI000972BB89|nr:glycosyltransferase family 52 [Winogradskyella sp. J14-2]APY07940.1 hypothetical protein BWZ20_06320 [Winogradskyella sp. J14-2]
MTKRYVLLVLSPFQFINVLEYLHAKSIDYSDCELVLLSERQIAINQIVNEFDEIKQFANIHIPMLGKGNYWLRFLKTKKLLNQFNTHTPIVGNLDNHWSKYVLKNVRKTRPVVVDDGAATINILKLRNKNQYRTSRGTILNQKGFLEFLFLNPKKPLPKSITFFTCFNILPGKQDELLINNFSYTKQKYLDNQVELINEVWFLGSPLLEKQFITQEASNTVFKTLKVFAENNHLKIKYFPHRVENLDRRIDFEIVKNTMPFEMFYFKASKRPKFILGYFSTSLYVLSRMSFNTQFMAIAINRDWRGNANWNRIDEVYEFFVQNNIKVVNVKTLLEL